jgi:hypothetical protein
MKGDRSINIQQLSNLVVVMVNKQELIKNIIDF